MSPEQENNRNRILHAAEKIFAEKGYDAARIDQIAADAGVNKALIYYYFKNKRALLEDLFEGFFRESAALLVRYVQKGGLDPNPSPEADQIFDSYFSYFETKRDLLRIMLMESLKRGEGTPPVFNLVDFGGLIDQDTVSDVRGAGLYPSQTMNLTLVAEFFTGVIPMLCYILFQDSWCRHFQVSREQLKDYFNQSMEMTHEAYHRTMREQWSGKEEPG
jgi:AcrR family transcriptional regulator